MTMVSSHYIRSSVNNNDPSEIDTFVVSDRDLARTKQIKYLGLMLKVNGKLRYETASCIGVT